MVADPLHRIGVRDYQIAESIERQVTGIKDRSGAGWNIGTQRAAAKLIDLAHIRRTGRVRTVAEIQVRVGSVVRVKGQGLWLHQPVVQNQSLGTAQRDLRSGSQA